MALDRGFSSFKARLSYLLGRLFGGKPASQHAPTDPIPSVSEALGMALADPEAEASTFFRSLLYSPLFGIARREEGVPVLVRFSDAEGAPFVPVFSGRSYLPQDLPEGCHPIEMQGKELLGKAGALDCRVVLDPGQVRSRLFDPSGLESVLNLVPPSLQSEGADTFPSAP